MDLLAHPLLAVPHQELNRHFRGYQKTAESQMNNVVTTMTALKTRARDQKPLEKQKVLALTDKLLEKCAKMERDLERSSSQQVALYSKLASRVDWLQRCEVHDTGDRPPPPRDRPPPSAESLRSHKRQRLDVLVADHLASCGFNRSSVSLAAAAGVESLVDSGAHAELTRVTEALRERDCGPALKWCAVNKSKLRKIGSQLEFRLRIREFLEIVRAGRSSEGIAYAKKHLAQFQTDYPEDIRQAVGALAFEDPGRVSKYRQLFADSAWDALLSRFERDGSTVYSLSSQSMLTLHLCAGLAALKTPHCRCIGMVAGESSRGASDCPVCQPGFAAIARDLPMSHHENSRLVCSLTGSLMDHENPPLAFPGSGNCYSSKALRKMAAENGGFVRDPRSDERCALGRLRQVFIV